MASWATSGKAFPPRARRLAAVRQAEDEAAWRALGRVPDRHEWLGLPDGGVSSLPFDDVVAMVERILVEEQPAVVATFGPDGISGHPDHVTIGAATDAAFARVRGRGGSGFQRLVHSAVPQSVVDRWNRRRAELGLFEFDPTEVYHLRGVPDEQIGITVDCRAVAGRIGAGLREHRSQHHVMSDVPDNPEQWDKRIKDECHVVAWPARSRSADADRSLRRPLVTGADACLRHSAASRPGRVPLKPRSVRRPGLAW